MEKLGHHNHVANTTTKSYSQSDFIVQPKQGPPSNSPSAETNDTQGDTYMNGTTNGQDPAYNWFQMPKVDSFLDLITISCSLAVIFGGIVPYIPQYLKIKRSMNSDGFSTYGQHQAQTS